MSEKSYSGWSDEDLEEMGYRCCGECKTIDFGQSFRLHQERGVWHCKKCQKKHHADEYT